ncbi:MAG: hypothetical protein ACJ79F_02980 [Gemmatimonadaceae bacterium]
MRHGIGQESSRARRLEVEVSMIPVLGSVAFSSSYLIPFFTSVASALFVRDDRASLHGLSAAM